jgi:hypothetical protein
VLGPFAKAMSQSMLLPAGLLVAGLVVVLFFERPQHPGFAPEE